MTAEELREYREAFMAEDDEKDWGR